MNSSLKYVAVQYDAAGHRCHDLMACFQSTSIVGGICCGAEFTGSCWDC